MAQPSKGAIVHALLARHGRTYASEIGISSLRNTPAPLYRMLCGCLLFSARISSDIAAEAARALWSKRWTTPDKMASSTWEDRARTLNEAGYARYDERTARMLGETTELLLDRYDGDLRRLRDEADRDPASERKLLKRFKGIGDVGVDIFFREVQGVWDELYPFLDRRATAGAEALGLGTDPAALRRLVSREELPRLVAALVRVKQESDVDATLEAA